MKRWWQGLSGLLGGVALLLSGCQTWPTVDSAEAKAPALAEAIWALRGAPARTPEQEAAVLAFAEAAQAEALRLREAYGFGVSANLHNVLVNTGHRDRGLCYQWAQDLFDHLCPLAPEGLHFQFVRAHPGHRNEHTAFVVGWAKTHWYERLVLDGWRHSGNLAFVRVRYDRWPWQPYDEDSHYTTICSVAWRPMWPLGGG